MSGETDKTRRYVDIYWIRDRFLDLWYEAEAKNDMSTMTAMSTMIIPFIRDLIKECEDKAARKEVNG